MKILFKPLLAANYCAAKWIVNKNLPKRVIPTALHTFTTPFAFISAGLYCTIMGTIDYKFKTFLPIFIGLGIVMLSISFFIEKEAKKAFYKWDIEKEYQFLNKSQRSNRNTFAFLFFWAGFALFFYLAVTFTEGYLVK
ncbi:hypothetical protein QUH73_04145 [Labilibaculum sp. K2S]|uniref:hypothetical protein n=1 Tax=Labilibaculum sp. K2S TaxID=3056386 RepID=UPI0025A43DBD|nr:hypothetical protein [Labilibaculum sp. K2S]MDM8159006.1 hypothetical protein [Labilibaculum sp. K2S]